MNEDRALDRKLGFEAGVNACIAVLHLRDDLSSEAAGVLASAMRDMAVKWHEAHAAEAMRP